MKNNQDIGTALKSKLEDLHNSPDDFVWDAIEDKLKKKKRRLLFWYFTFGLGLIILTLFIYNTVNKNAITNFKSQDLNTKIVEQEDHLNSLSPTDFETKNVNQQANKTLNTEEQPSNTTQSLHNNLVITKKESTPSFKNSKNSYDFITPSKNQKRSNSEVDQQKNDKNLQPYSKEANNAKSLAIANQPDVKAAQTHNKKGALQKGVEKVPDSLLKTKDDVVSISEKEDSLEENSIKDSLVQRQIKWSINPQLVISNYSAFGTKTKDNTSINYSLLLGAQITHNTFLRVGVRKLDLMQTVNNSANSVSYLEFPLEAKYLFSDKTFNSYATGGLSYFKLDGKSVESSTNLEYDDTMSLNIGLGIEHKLFDRFYINLESNLNYLIKPISSNINYTPYIFSISTGIDYRF
jgi:hypothetical protein